MMKGHREEHANILIIGAGQAGLSAAAKLRALDHKGSITLVGDESYLPYQRPPLSKAYLLGEMSPERILLRPAEFYNTQDIVVKASTSVVAIHPAAHSVTLSDGNDLDYDKLIIATGSRPRRLPQAIGGELQGVYYMRSIADVDAMAPEFMAGRKLLVIGGGYIGLEAAAIGAKLGLKVTILEASERILQRVAAVETSQYYRDLHRSHGVDIRENISLKELIEENGRVCGARLSDNSIIEADFVICGIGVIPNQELAQEAGLIVNNGIHVDEFCRTSDPDIFAVGDCASFIFRDKRIRLESVGNAIEQAEAVAAFLTGKKEHYVAKPWFWSDQFEAKLQIAGLSAGHDKVISRISNNGAKSFWYYQGSKLLAVDAINDPRVFMVAKRLIGSDISPSYEHVANAELDVKSLLEM